MQPHNFQLGESKKKAQILVYVWRLTGKEKRTNGVMRNKKTNCYERGRKGNEQEGGREIGESEE